MDLLDIGKVENRLSINRYLLLLRGSWILDVYVKLPVLGVLQENGEDQSEIVQNPIFSKQRYTLCGLFHCFVALEKISLVYLTMLSITLIQRPVHRVRVEPYTNVLRQSFAISNVSRS